MPAWHGNIHDHHIYRLRSHQGHDVLVCPTLPNYAHVRGICDDTFDAFPHHDMVIGDKNANHLPCSSCSCP